MTPLTSLPPRVREIIETAAINHGLTPADILGRAQAPHIVAARWEAAHKLKLTLRDDGSYPTYPQVGRWLSLDHSSVMYACGRHSGRPSPPPRKNEPRAVVRDRKLADYVARLSWRYDADRVASILAGQDAATIIDIAKWRTLGIVPRA